MKDVRKKLLKDKGRKLKELLPGDCHLFPLSAGAFAHRLKLIQAALGLPPWVTPGSFRPGGATLLWLRFRNFESIRLRGRWAAPGRTLEHYLQECLTYYGEGSLAEHTRKKIREVASQAAALVVGWLRE